MFMSSPARAEGYDTPTQEREDSPTFMLAISSPARAEGGTGFELATGGIRMSLTTRT